MSREKPYLVQEILAATGNADKIKELGTIAEEFSITLISPAELALREGLASPPEVEETENTYFGNAMLKAKAYARWSGIPSLADDSGLEVAALKGAPGVHSARYAGEGASAEDRWRKVLAELEKLQNPALDRSAAFRCSLVLFYPEGMSLSAEGSLAGRILESPQGEGGFGYDPIVHITELGKTLAEIPFSETCRIGFRAKAARELFNSLGSLARKEGKV